MRSKITVLIHHLPHQELLETLPLRLGLAAKQIEQVYLYQSLVKLNPVSLPGTFPPVRQLNYKRPPALASVINYLYKKDFSCLAVIDGRHLEGLGQLSDLPVFINDQQSLFATVNSLVNGTSFNHRTTTWRQSFASTNIEESEESNGLNPFIWFVKPALLKQQIPRQLLYVNYHHPHLLSLALMLTAGKTQQRVSVVNVVHKTTSDIWPSALTPYTGVDYWQLGLLYGQLIPLTRVSAFWKNTLSKTLRTSLFERSLFLSGLVVDTARRLLPFSRPLLRSIASPASAITNKTAASNSPTWQQINRVSSDYRQTYLEIPLVAFDQPKINQDSSRLYNQDPSLGRLYLEEVINNEELKQLTIKQQFQEYLTDQRHKNPRLPLQIALTLPAINIRGAERYVNSLFKYLDPTIFKLKIVTLDAGSQLGRWWQKEGLPIFQPANDLSKYNEVDWLVEQIKDCDIVYNLLTDDWAIWEALNKLSPRPQIFTRITNLTSNYTTPLMSELVQTVTFVSNISRQRFLPELFPRAEFLTAYSPASFDFLPRLQPDDRKQLKKQYGLDENKHTLLWVGRLSAWEKNVPLLKAAITASKDLPVQWVVIGYFQYPTAAIAVKWQRFAQKQNVVWLPHLINYQVPPYYQLADYLISTSHIEGLPGSVRDALTFGTPTLAFDSGGVREAIVSGATGLLTPPNQEIFLDALRQLLTVPAQDYQSWERQSQQLARARFNPEANIKQLGAKFLQRYFEQQTSDHDPA